MSEHRAPAPRTWALLRVAVYVVSGLGTLIVAYGVDKGWFGDSEVALWAGVVALVNGLAALNVDTKKDSPE